MEYVNRDGGWWQGTAKIADVPVRVDLQQPANPPDHAVDAAAKSLEWIQEHEPSVRGHIGRRFAAGDYIFHALKEWHGTQPTLTDDPAVLQALCPNMVVLWGHGSVQFRYSCDALPRGSLYGAHEVEVWIGEQRELEGITVHELDFSRRLERLLERPVPQVAADFVNSIGDQFLARAAWGPSLELDEELRSLLDQAIAEAQDRASRDAPACRTYMNTVKALLG